jgi:DNA adenine methylase
MSRHRLRIPFPYVGGKQRVADLVWRQLGDPDSFVEPFCGSAAVLLARPFPGKIETINDENNFVANFWRAVQADPDKVAEYADNPVNEADLAARHLWLMLSQAATEFREKMRTDPHYYDPKVAGWWAWGACCWIGAGWCQDTGEAIGTGRRPQLSSRPQLADARSRGRGVHGNDAANTCEERRAWLVDWMRRLRDRIRNVRVLCGDWKRCCNSPSTMTRLGTCGVFLDPPYSHDVARMHAWVHHLEGRGEPPEGAGKATNRDRNLYASDGGDMDRLVADVHVWCRKWGADSQVRIVLAGMAGEHDDLENLGWEVHAWKSSGYANRTATGRENNARERLWFSPHVCKPERVVRPMFTIWEKGDHACV